MKCDEFGDMGKKDNLLFAWHIYQVDTYLERTREWPGIVLETNKE